jgi:hypothetical protein
MTLAAGHAGDVVATPSPDVPLLAMPEPVDGGLPYVRPFHRLARPA